MARNDSISSLLRADYGIEDFTAGVVSQAHMGLEGVDLANKLGLLAPIGEKHNTDTTVFGIEAANLLGESNEIARFGADLLKSAEDRFAIANEIKKGYGVEGFDAFTFGMEGFGDKLKSIGASIVSAFKKLIQSISNFIKMVINFIRGVVAKTQNGAWEKYKEWVKTHKKLEGKQVKGILPKEGATPATILTAFQNPVKEFCNDTLDSFNTGVVSVAKGEGRDASIKFGGDIGVINKTTKAKDIAVKLVYGKNTKKTYDVSKVLAGNVEAWMGKAALAEMNKFVKVGKLMITNLTTCLKTVDKALKSGQSLGINEAKIQNYGKDAKADRKEAIKEVKDVSGKLRGQIKAALFHQNIGGKLTSVVYTTYGYMLSVRSLYTAAARHAMGAAKKADKESEKKKK